MAFVLYMDLEKIYHDVEGNECNILQLVKKEPEWAANRIQIGEKYKEMWKCLKECFKQVICPSKAGDIAIMEEIEKHYLTGLNNGT